MPFSHVLTYTISSRTREERVSCGNRTRTLCLMMIVGFLKQAGADINASDKCKRTPTYIAARENNVAALKVLIAEGELCRACHTGTYKGKSICITCMRIKCMSVNTFASMR